MRPIHKTKTFIKDEYRKIKGTIKTVHERLKGTTQDDLIEPDSVQLNVYQQFIGWVLDYPVQIGIPLTIVAITVFNRKLGLHSLSLPIGFGCMVWLFLHILSLTMKTWREGR